MMHGANVAVAAHKSKNMISLRYSLEGVNRKVFQSSFVGMSGKPSKYLRHFSIDLTLSKGECFEEKSEFLEWFNFILVQYIYVSGTSFYCFTRRSFSQNCVLLYR